MAKIDDSLPVQDAPSRSKESPDADLGLRQEVVSQLDRARSDDNAAKQTSTPDRSLSDTSKSARDGNFDKLKEDLTKFYEKTNGDPAKLKEFGKQLQEKLSSPPDTGIKVNTDDAHSLSLEKDGKSVKFKMDGQLDPKTGKIDYNVKAESGAANKGDDPKSVVEGFSGKVRLEPAKLEDGTGKPSPFDGGGKFSPPPDTGKEEPKLEKPSKDNPPSRPDPLGDGGGKFQKPDPFDDLGGGAKFDIMDELKAPGPELVKPEVDHLRPSPFSDGGAKLPSAKRPFASPELEKPKAPLPDGGGKFETNPIPGVPKLEAPPKLPTDEGGGKFEPSPRPEVPQLEKPIPQKLPSDEGGGKFEPSPKPEVPQLEKPKPQKLPTDEGGGKFEPSPRPNAPQLEQPIPQNTDEGGGKFESSPRPNAPQLEKPAVPSRPWNTPLPSSPWDDGGGKFEPVPSKLPQVQLEKPRPNPFASTKK